jgi:hypothetical protein
VGAKYQGMVQREDSKIVFNKTLNYGLLDYVACWYFKAAEYIQDTAIQVGVVSTNSITQGEQVGVLWAELFKQGIKINFAYTRFKWANEARGKAHVHCVIIGFAFTNARTKRIFEEKNGRITVNEVRNISPYIIDAPNTLIVNRSKPLCDVPEIGIGNKPIDGGSYLFTDAEKKEFLKIEPAAAPYFRKWLGADEFINGWHRWCLWLGDCPPNELRKMKECIKRVEAVRKFRLNSKSAPTRKLANHPTRFHVENMPNGTYILIPRVSSERRSYIPIGFVKKQTIASDATLIFPDAKLYHFGILTSTMHMDWVRQVCGRLEIDYRYSAKLVYNNFPWPEPTDAQRKNVEEAAHAVLDARAVFSSSTLADIYDPNSMPTNLKKAHLALDRAVERCYRSKPVHSDQERLEFLFEMYEKLTAAEK